MNRRVHLPSLNCHCGKVALYRVYKAGFCKEHYEDGVKAAEDNTKKLKAFAIAGGFKRVK